MCDYIWLVQLDFFVEWTQFKPAKGGKSGEPDSSRNLVLCYTFYSWAS